MFTLYLAKRPRSEDVDFDELAHLTDKRVSSDIKFLVDEASRKALREDSKISQAILAEAISQTKPSVDSNEIDRYEAMRNSMSVEGSNKSERPSIGFQFGVKSNQ